MQNPFSPSFSQIPKINLSRENAQNIILDNVFNADYATSTFITGPRRCGKTVLMQSVKREIIQHKNTTVIYLQNSDTLLDQLEAILADKTTTTKVKLFSLIEFERKSSNKNQQIALLKKLAEICKKQHLVIEIDDVTNSSQIRKFAQLKGEANANDILFDVIMTGLPEVVNEITSNKELTFLLRSDKINLQPLDRLEIAKSYRKLLNITDQKLVRRLVKITKGYAYAFQLLGKLLFDRQPISENTIKEIEQPYFEKLVSDSYIKIFEELTENEKRYLINVNNCLKAKEIAELWHTSLPNVSQYKRILIKKGIISQNSIYGKVNFELPLFAEYLNAVCDPENLFYAGFDKNTGKLAEY